MADSLLDLGSVSDVFYRGYSDNIVKANWTNAPEENTVQNREVLQYVATATDINVVDSRKKVEVEYSFLCENRERQYDLWRFFWKRLGRYERFWLPLEENYFELFTDIDNNDGVINVYNIGYNDIYEGYERLFIKTKSGDLITRKITSVSDGGDYESINLESNMDRDLTSRDIYKMGRLILARFDIDRLDLSYRNCGVATTSIRFVEVPGDYSTL